MARRVEVPPAVLALFERAAAGTDPLTCLLLAWDALPAAELAAAIEASPEPALAEVTTSNAVDGLARLSRVHTRRDPRVAAALVGWVTDPPWHATAAKPFYAQVFERLVQLGDPRAIEGLAHARRRVSTAVKGATMRGWLVEQIDHTRDALATRFPEGVPKLTPAARVLARTAGQRAATAKPPARVPSRRTDAAAELIAAIRADPADCAARQVYADLLAELDDPRGPFIAMQLARAGREPTSDERTAELAILARHAPRWLEELAGIVVLKRRALGVGPARHSARVRFEGGFLAGATIWGSAAKLTALVGHGAFATVEDLEIRPKPVANITHAAGERRTAFVALLCNTAFPALRSLGIGAELLPEVLRADCMRQLERLAISGPVSTDHVVIANTPTLAGLPELRFVFHAASEPPMIVGAATAALGMRALRQLEVVHATAAVSYERDDGRWRARITSGPDTSSAAALVALVGG